MLERCHFYTHENNLRSTALRDVKLFHGIHVHTWYISHCHRQHYPLIPYARPLTCTILISTSEFTLISLAVYKSSNLVRKFCDATTMYGLPTNWIETLFHSHLGVVNLHRLHAPTHTHFERQSNQSCFLFTRNWWNLGGWHFSLTDSQSIIRHFMRFD